MPLIPKRKELEGEFGSRGRAAGVKERRRGSRNIED